MSYRIVLYCNVFLLDLDLDWIVLYCIVLYCIVSSIMHETCFEEDILHISMHIIFTFPAIMLGLD